MKIKEYLMVCLMEELAEVSQELSKCLRFTADHSYAKGVPSNIEKVRLEVADVIAISSMLAALDIDTGLVCERLPEPQATRFQEKLLRTLELMKISVKNGTISEKDFAEFLEKFLAWTK